VTNGTDQKSVWAAGDAYEPYVGRWSRPVASQFLRWLDLSAGLRWLDVGCGTGALTETVLEATSRTPLAPQPFIFPGRPGLI
jgi:2-polyprenyl-3-methyl-5-hydroxy-6-metoxy-1,4-benzoquinol methylase